MHLECYTRRKCLPWYVDLFFFPNISGEGVTFNDTRKVQWLIEERYLLYFVHHHFTSVTLIFTSLPKPVHLHLNYLEHSVVKYLKDHILGQIFFPPIQKSLSLVLCCHLKWESMPQEGSAVALELTVLDRIHASETSVQSCARWHVCVCRGLLLGWDRTSRLWSGVDQSSVVNTGV